MLRKVTGCRWRRDFLNIVLTNGGSICLELNDSIIVPKQLLYSHFKEYIAQKGGYIPKEATFFKNLIGEIKSLEDIGQKRVANIKGLSADRPRFVKGIYVKSSEIISFPHGKEDILTNCINYDHKSRVVVQLQKDILND